MNSDILFEKKNIIILVCGCFISNNITIAAFIINLDLFSNIISINSKWKIMSLKPERVMEVLMKITIQYLFIKIFH